MAGLIRHVALKPSANRSDESFTPAIAPNSHRWRKKESADRGVISMLPLFAAVFIDLFSFGLMYPVIVALFAEPSLLHAYGTEGVNIRLSLAFSLFPLGMFFGAALLGDLSDMFGRRRTLLICMTGLGAANLIMLAGVQTGILDLFLAGRLLSGLLAGTSPIAQAAMVEYAGPSRRGDALSHVVLVNCLALVSGPAAGGLLGHLDFRAPLGFAVVLCALAGTWIASSRTQETPHHQPLRLDWCRSFQIFAAAWHHRKIRALAGSFFLFQFGFALYYVYILVRMKNAYHLPTAALGLFSAVLGAGFVLGSIVFYQFAARCLRQRQQDVAVLGLVLCGAFILLSALPMDTVAQWVLALLAATANVLAFVALLALISAAATEDEQGWALGISAAMTAASFFLSGLFASALGAISVPLLLSAGGIIVVSGVLPLLGAGRSQSHAGQPPAAQVPG
jgi:DHA1 family tetracycline resistance protein-like MFS transporter